MRVNLEIAISDKRNCTVPIIISCQAKGALLKEKVATSGQHHIQPQQRSEQLSSMAEDLDQRVKQLGHLKKLPQDSNSQSMPHAFHYELRQVKHKTPCRGHQPKC